MTVGQSDQGVPSAENRTRETSRHGAWPVRSETSVGPETLSCSRPLLLRPVTQCGGSHHAVPAQLRRIPLEHMVTRITMLPTNNRTNNQQPIYPSNRTSGLSCRRSMCAPIGAWLRLAGLYWLLDGYSKLRLSKMLRYWTAGESHGKTLLALVDGFPAGVTIDTAPIDDELQRRQGGYGRGGRQRIETDRVEILTGIWKGVSLGSPIALQVVNHDYKLERMEDLTRPRPGHGDLAGAIKFLGPIRGVLERASARETAVRVAAGALAKQLLASLRHPCDGLRGGVGRDPHSIRPHAPGTQRLQRRAESRHLLA